MSRLLAVFTLIILGAAACSTNPQGPPGKDIIPPDDLVDLLSDLHYYDGVISHYNDIIDNGDTIDFYAEIFSKHGVDKLRFERSMNYYAFDPVNFERMYEQVVEKLNRRQSELSAITRDDPETFEPENIWNMKRNWSFPEDGANELINVDVPVEGPGIYTFSAQIRMQPQDFSENPRITLWFWYDDGTEEGYRDYFEEERINKDGRIRNYSMTKELSDTNVTRLRGKVLNHSNPDSIWVKHADVYNIKLEYQKIPLSEDPDPDPDQVEQMNRNNF